jgi:lipopolysaccharide/colanic/teichoic acid biosynthesis glycosyltransferase
MAEAASQPRVRPEDRRLDLAPAADSAFQQGLSPAQRRDYILRRAFVVSDLLALVLATGATVLLQKAFDRQIDDQWLLIVAVLLPLWLPIGISARLYHLVGRGDMPGIADEFGSVLRVATIWSWLVLVARAFVSDDFIQLLPSLGLWAFSVVAVLLLRALVRLLARHRPWYRQRALVIGGPDDTARVVSRINRHPEWGIEVVGTRTLPGQGQRFDDGNANGDHASLDAARQREPTLGSDVLRESSHEQEGALQALALLDSVRERDVARVIFASHPRAMSQRTTFARALNASGIQVDLVPGDADILRTNAEVHHLEGLPVISLPPASLPRSFGLVKRGFDLIVAIPLLILASPVFAYSAIRIKLDSPGPVVFRQPRVGRGRETFEFLKLRSMVDDADERLDEVAERSLHGNGIERGMFKAVDDPRVTSFGHWLRRWSVDEIPQLWNVIRGDMSLVGPRPLPVAEDRRIGEDFHARYEVRPGITGPWQVLGRSDIPFDDMVRLDYTYVMNWSLTEDVKLLLRTIAAVVEKRGAY